jgi:hypothetical protein
MYNLTVNLKHNICFKVTTLEIRNAPPSHHSLFKVGLCDEAMRNASWGYHNNFNPIVYLPSFFFFLKDKVPMGKEDDE